MSFLPQNYEAPKSSNHYLKLAEGENRIRILSAPVMGWEDWENKKPIRYTMDNKPLTSVDPKKPARHFWSFIVFNYLEEQIQIMHVTQATIRKALEALCKDTDWGDPYNYDIKINKAGEGVDTEYTVNPVPHKTVDAYIIKQFDDRKCNLEALFTNSDPFSSEWKTFTPLALKQERKKSADDIAELKALFESAPAEYQAQLLAQLGKLSTPVKKIEDVPPNLYERVHNAIVKKLDEYQQSAMESALI